MMAQGMYSIDGPYPGDASAGSRVEAGDTGTRPRGMALDEGAAGEAKDVEYVDAHEAPPRGWSADGDHGRLRRAARHVSRAISRLADPRAGAGGRRRLRGDRLC